MPQLTPLFEESLSPLLLMQEDEKGLSRTEVSVGQRQLGSRTQECSLGTETTGALLMDSFRLG